MIREAIFKLVDKKDLTYDEAYAVIDEIMEGETTDIQTSAFLAALSTKSTRAETIDEICGCAAAMRSHAVPVPFEGEVLDIVGTGGDGSCSFNISTTAALVIAAGGVKVAKHGNRAASSRSGTADCLEALGVNISIDPGQAVRLLDQVGICFLFAQRYHTAMRYVGPIRKELGIRTVFNILGPLTNPANPDSMVLGVYDPLLVEPVARVLAKLGVRRGMVVHGRVGLDELSTAGTTMVCEFDDDGARTYELDAAGFGMDPCEKEDLEGGDPQENALITCSILQGERGARRDTVLLNAGAGLYVGGAAASLSEGVVKAAALIDGGDALRKLEEFKTASQAAVPMDGR